MSGNFGRAASAFAAIFLFSGAQAQTCGLKLVTSYAMADDREGRLVVPVTVAHTAQHMIIDTGSPFGILATDTVNALKLPKYDMQGTMYSMAGRMNHFTEADVELGPMHGNGVQFVETSGFSSWKDAGIAGVLGMNLLSRFDLDLDFGAAKVNLFLPDHCPGQVVYWTKSYAVVPFDLDAGGKVKVEVTLDGKTLEAIVDTGSTDSILSPAIAHGSFDLDDSGAQTGPGGPYMATLHTLAIGGITVQNPRFYVLRDKIGSDEQTDEALSGDSSKGLPGLLIGNDILRRLHVYFAFKEKKIYVTAADAH